MCAPAKLPQILKVQEALWKNRELTLTIADFFSYISLFFYLVVSALPIAMEHAKHMHTYTHTNTCTHTHTCTNTCTHTCTNTCTCTHTKYTNQACIITHQCLH